jgi:ParB-like chromosome segregation protein Spo0J
MAMDWGEILPHYPEITGIHPVANLFPMIDGEDLAALCADIKERGLQQPIIVWHDGSLIDGRNRLIACYRTHQEVVLETYDGDEPVQFSLSANLHRRHLNQGQKAMVALKVEELFAAEAKKRQGQRTDLAPKPQDIVAKLPQCGAPPATEVPSNPLTRLPSQCLTAGQRAVVALEIQKELHPLSPAPKARDQAAAVVGASGRSVQMAKAVTKAAPDLAEKVERGAIPLHRAYREVQERAMNQPPPEELKWPDDQYSRRKIVEAGGTVVANMHNSGDEMLLRWARSSFRFVQIDRRSDWGNPYEIPGDGDRDQVCDSFELYFSRKISLHIRLNELRGKVLGCWCYPERCHGEHLIKQLEQSDGGV